MAISYFAPLLSLARAIAMARVVLVVMILLALPACAGAKLFDKTKSDLANEAQENYSEISITGIVDEALENYDELREESLKIVTKEAAVRRERAILQIASSTQSMADWLDKRKEEMKDLGFVVGKISSAKEIGVYNGKLITLRSLRRDVVTSGGLLRAAAGRKAPPECSANNQSKQAWFDKNLPKDPARQKVYGSAYRLYLSDCVKLTQALPAMIATGTLGQAISAEIAAQTRRAAELQEAEDRLEALRTARKNYNDAEDEAKDSPSDKAKDDLKKATEELQKALKEAQDLLDLVGVDEPQREYMEKIGVLLMAIGSGKIDETEAQQDPDLKEAATILTEVSSLAFDATAFLETGRKPSLSGLLIELNHQRILSDRAQEFASLTQRSLALHQEKVAALSSYANLLRQVQFRLCNYAVLMEPGNQEWPGLKCETLIVEPQNGGGGNCLVGSNNEQITVSNCALNQTWRAAFKSASDALAKRQLYEAVYLYAEALDARTESAAVDFKLIDIEHRRAAIANRSALLAWNNLVEVPISTLAAYHASGIKPDSLAQTIAILLGLTGIAVGASQ